MKRILKYLISGMLLFTTGLGMTVLKVEFTNAYCVNLTRQISQYVYPSEYTPDYTIPIITIQGDNTSYKETR
jgi:hypothetical protein